ncbi:uncharacterized protein LOC111884700 [Lactuca sativa]|uniref:uncharacterized protein LOC111884700 n=1 Tax=Lactuca sativa TaxID=4236 RepID=UPI000CD94092|nr:uncharacterized protein LOC111884700 [Lactuca sativa]
MDVYRKYSYGDEVTVVEGQYLGKRGQYVHPTHAIVLADGTVIHVEPWDLCAATNQAKAAVVTTPNRDLPLKQQEVGDSVHIETGNYHGQTGMTDKRGTNKRSRNE